MKSEKVTVADPVVGIDTMLEGLNIIQEHIRFADTKAGLIAAFHVAIFGFMASQADAIRTAAESDRGTLGFWLRSGLLIGYGVCALVAFFYAVACIWPRTGENAAECFIHATYVARHYKRDYRRYCDDLAKADEKTLTAQVGTQIVENSNISVQKFKFVGRSAQWTIVTVILWAAMLVASGLASAKSGSFAATQPVAAAH